LLASPAHRHQIDGQHADVINMVKLLIGSDVPGVLESEGLGFDALTLTFIRGNSHPYAHVIRQSCDHQVSTRQPGVEHNARARLHRGPG